MNSIPTGKYTIIRGTPTENEYGDTVDTQTNLLSGVSGSVIERRSRNFDPQSGRIVTLREYTGRFKFGTDIQDGDRVKDEKSGIVYLVDSVTQPTTIVGKQDIILELSTN